MSHCDKMGSATLERGFIAIGDAHLDQAFLKRTFRTSMAFTAFAALVGAVYIGMSWGGHYLAAGFWININAVLLARLLLAFVAKPQRPIEAALFGLGKVFWFACLFGYCAFLQPPASALLAGLMTLPFVFFLKVMGLAWAKPQRGAAGHNDNSGVKN